LRGHAVRLAIPPGQLAKLSPAENLAIRDFALKHNVGLLAAEAPPFANGARALATVEGGGVVSQAWASREIEPRSPGPGWGRPINHPVVKGSTQVTTRFSAVDLETLLPPPGAQLVEIGPELDGDLARFGGRASKMMIQLLTRCNAWPGEGVLRMSYRDPYISSPLVARLLLDTVAEIISASGGQQADLDVETRQPRGDRHNPWQIAHDWVDAADQRAVIELFARQKGVRASVRHGDVPHGRYLGIEFKNGGRATIVLDQGFGAWSPPKATLVRHDFNADAAAQAMNLARVNTGLQRRGFGKTYMVATPA
jgi:hypothetical protein